MSNPFEEKPELNSPVVIMPGEPAEQPVEEVVVEEEVVEKVEEKPVEAEKAPETPPSRSIMELANNPDFSVATIAKEAKRIKERDKDEVFISLH